MLASSTASSRATEQVDIAERIYGFIIGWAHVGGLTEIGCQGPNFRFAESADDHDPAIAASIYQNLSRALRANICAVHFPHL